EASRRGSSLDEEVTQGNGGKAYMFRLFRGSTRILGVREGHRNCKGFEGEPGTVARGTAGWVPNLAAGREVGNSSVHAELREGLRPYDVAVHDLPDPILKAASARKAFTLVEGEDPDGLYKGRIDVENLIANLVRHEQSTLCLEQVDFFVVHNGRLLNEG